MNFSTANLEDIPVLCELLGYLFDQEKEFSPNEEIQKSALEKIISSPEIGHILIAKENDQILGMVNLLYTVSTALGSRVALLEDMVVASNYRRRKIGSLLLEFATQFAKDKGCKRITLLTDNDNKSAHRFYSKQGFIESKMTPFRLNL